MQFWKDIASALNDTLAAAAILVGGLWVAYRFIIERERHPKIQFDIDFAILGVHADQFLVEVAATFTNKGRVRHKLRDLHFDLFYLPEQGEIVFGTDEINNQVCFTKLYKGRRFFPHTWDYSFIDAGVTQRYSHVTTVPCAARFILVKGKFIYPDARSEFHTAQKARAVDKTSDQTSVVASAKQIR